MSTPDAFPEVTPEMLRRLDVPGPRYTSYPTVPEWSSEVGPDAQRERLVQTGQVGADTPLSIYLHLPFCQEMCTYCGCNVVISKDVGKADVYIDHLEREIAMTAELLGERRTFAQLHYGGGTPTFLTEPQLERLWGCITRHFRPTPDAEIAIEVDPVVTTASQLALLARCGFNRLSMGVQDFDEAVQTAVHRVQTVDQTRAIVEAGRSLGYHGVNFDLIYGLPSQTPDRWRRTLERVLDLAPDRLAVYSFAYLPDLRTHQRRIDATLLPKGGDKLALFGIAYETFVRRGYRPIGMDHFARAEDELARAQGRRTLFRNFQGYTVKAAADSVAFGITGISDTQGVFFQSKRPLSQYYEAIDAGRFATERGLILSDDDRRRREVITQIMCNFWVDLGAEGATYFAEELEDCRRLESEGLVRVTGTEIEATPLGRVFVRNVAMVFDAYLRRSRAQGKTPQFSRTV